MFGDYFSQRGDYSKGKSILEAPDDFKSRRALRNIRIANEQQKQNMKRSSFHIHFPDAKHREKFRNAANLVMNVISFEQTAKELSEAHRRKQLENENLDDWVCKFEAGVRIWVNRQTGEVRTKAPNQKRDRSPSKVASSPLKERRTKSRSSLSSGRRGSLSPNRTAVSSRMSSRGSSRGSTREANRKASLLGHYAGEGTGSLVYDDQDMKEFWQLLDNHGQKK